MNEQEAKEEIAQAKKELARLSKKFRHYGLSIFACSKIN